MPDVQNLPEDSLQLFCCPSCREDLERRNEKEDAFHCPSCGRKFPIYWGIPDFRMTSPTDVDRASGFAERFPTTSYMDMVRSSAPPGYHMYDLFLQIRATTAARALARRETLRPLVPAAAGRAADVGCGTGYGVLALSGLAKSVAGIDISLPDLVIACKFLAENHVSNAVLAAASCDRPPFRDRQFDAVTALDIIEHVENPENLIAECYRMLAGNGLLHFTSQNRYSLGLEPHVRVFALGFLPRTLQERFMRTFHPDRDHCAHPLSWLQLRRILARHAPGNASIDARYIDETVPARSLKGRIVKKYRPVTRLLNAVLWPFSETFQVTVRKASL